MLIILNFLYKSKRKKLCIKYYKIININTNKIL